MKMFKRLKQVWKWTFGYNLVIVTPKVTYTIHHKIGRQPKIDIEQQLQKLRGRSASIMILDEYVGGDNDHTKNS